MRIIPRGEWGARYGDGQGWARMPASEVWLHHSVTVAPDLVAPYGDDIAAVRRLDQIGHDRFGWAYGVPYTFVVTPAGLIFEGHHVSKMGAHTYGRNWSGRAICYVGNYERDRPTEDQLRATAWLLQHGYAQGWWAAPRLTGGHRDVSQTACPGRHADAQIHRINALAAGGPIEEEEDDDMPLVISKTIPAGKDATADMHVKGCREFYLACSYGHPVTLHAADFWGDSPPGKGGKGVGGWIRDFRFDPDRSGPVAIPPDATSMSIRYTADHSFDLTARS